MTATNKPTLDMLPSMRDVAAAIAEDAREHFAGVDVISVGPLLAEQKPGFVQYSVVVPDRGGKDFVVKTPISTTTNPPSRLNGRGRIP
jgi:hypothetical protein